MKSGKGLTGDLKRENKKGRRKKGKRKVQGVPQSQTTAFPDIKRKSKPTYPNKHKSVKHTKSTKISSLFPKRGNRNAKRTKKHKNKMAQGKTYNKSPHRINYKAPKSKTNTVTTALEFLPQTLIIKFGIYAFCILLRI